MSPRPRKASDAEVFEAAARVMQRLGPAQLTLADIAAEAGLTAGALVQRFGSKRELMLGLMEQSVGLAKHTFDALRAKHASPLAVLEAYADCVARMADTPATLAHHLSYLQLDFTDPDFHRHARAQARASRAELHALLDDAVAAGELPPGSDTAALARAVETTLTGSLMTWAFHQDGPAAAWLRADLAHLLALHRRAAGER